MVLDYCERRPVSKNRPKKQPVGMLVFIIVGGAAISFAAGFAGGWYFGGRAAKKSIEAAAVTKAVATAATVPQAKPAGQDVPLTFYQTLPNGAKAVIGSGLNPSKAHEEQKKIAEPSSPERKPLPPTAAGTGPEAAADPKPMVKGQQAGGGSYCVQVASLKDKKEAEAIKAKLLAKGQAAYILESTVPDKGVWYRVRLGRHLNQSEAGELAAKAGKGAIVIAE
ncbi:SPOR domain-containing protein [Geotalea sp. SG265]|uniref:SPOR domain-containing protein n=1 Tax=Geotalea sp. SG265 TaxID=2922867 RepID=UPI001FAF12A6|nr:SPOR domain-containing protein [Geotalea sp. SG265]